MHVRMIDTTIQYVCATFLHTIKWTRSEVSVKVACRSTILTGCSHRSTFIQLLLVEVSVNVACLSMTATDHRHRATTAEPDIKSGNSIFFIHSYAPVFMHNIIASHFDSLYHEWESPPSNIHVNNLVTTMMITSWVQRCIVGSKSSAMGNSSKRGKMGKRGKGGKWVREVSLVRWVIAVREVMACSKNGKMDNVSKRFWKYPCTSSRLLV